MKAIIVYYSLEGNTAFAAEKIADALGADTLQLNPVKEYPKSGIKKFLWGGKSAVMSETPKLEPYTFRGEDYDLILFGFPVWASNITPPLRTFIKENNLEGKRIAAFACESGSGAEKAFEKLKALLKAEKLESETVLIDPKTKPSEENDRKITAFCNALLEN